MLIVFNYAILLRDYFCELCDGDRQQVTEMSWDGPAAAAQQRVGLTWENRYIRCSLEHTVGVCMCAAGKNPWSFFFV